MKFVALDNSYLPMKALEEIAGIEGVSEVELYDRTPSDEQELFHRVSGAQMVSSRLFVQYDKKLLDHAADLKAIFLPMVGYNHVDVDYASQKGVYVYNCAGYNAEAVSEMAMGVLLSLLRKIPSAQHHVRAGGIEYKIFEGAELHGKTVGVFGAGRVGGKIIHLLRAFGCKVLVHTKNPSAARAREHGLKDFSTKAELLKKSEVVILALPLDSTTKGIIGKRELAMMRKGSVLINIGRQNVVEEQAVIDAVLSGRLGGFGADIFLEDPLDIKLHPIAVQEFVKLPNVLITPHIAGEAVEANKRLVKVFLQNIENFLNGSNTKYHNLVNQAQLEAYGYI
jgi:phosphoglycerate dehydrogenase-like enzyme